MTELMKHQIYLFGLLTFTQDMTDLMIQSYLVVLKSKGQTNKFDVSLIQSYLVV
jgi:hypothetical protein